jgi:hypothetical protein
VGIPEEIRIFLAMSFIRAALLGLAKQTSIRSTKKEKALQAKLKKGDEAQS